MSRAWGHSSQYHPLYWPVGLLTHVFNARRSHVVELCWKGGTVSTQVLEDQPTANIYFWQHSCSKDAIQAVTGWSPDNTLKQRWIFWQREKRNWWNLLGFQRKGSEGTIRTVIYIVYELGFVVLCHYLACQETSGFSFFITTFYQI